MFTLILTGALLAAPLNAPRLGNTLVPPRFCAGIRSAETQTGWKYDRYLAEFALSTISAKEIEKSASAEAIAKGADPQSAYVRGLEAREKAKAAMAKTHLNHVQSGQKKLCK